MNGNYSHISERLLVSSCFHQSTGVEMLENDEFYILDIQ